MYKLDLEKAEEPEIKHPLYHRKSKRIPEKHLLLLLLHCYFCLTDYTKSFACVEPNKLWEILKQMGTPDHLVCLLSNLYASQEATVRTRHGQMDWFQIVKDCILSPCLFNFCAEYIM